MIVPTLLDLARMPVTVHCDRRVVVGVGDHPVARGDVAVRPMSTVSGLATPSSSAADRVTAFMTEPGSKTSETTGLPSRSGSVFE